MDSGALNPSDRSGSSFRDKHEQGQDGYCDDSPRARYDNRRWFVLGCQGKSYPVSCQQEERVKMGVNGKYARYDVGPLHERFPF